MESSQRAALPNTLKKRNYLTILNAFRGTEPLSANDVSASTGISRATVMKAVNHFMEKGLLESAGKGPSTEIGGKKPELFQFGMQRYLLCIGMQGEEMTACLYDLRSSMIAQKKAAFHMDCSVQDFLNTVQQTADEMLQEVPGGRELLYGMSLFVGGVFQEETGVLQYSVLTPGWGYNVPLRDLLAERFPGIEIMIDNVARMSACAAVLDNRDYEKRRVAVVYTDVGVSACYIDKGHVQHGPNGMIGEIGPMVLSISETQPYTWGQPAFFSTLISEEKLCAQVLANPEELEKSSLKFWENELTLRHIFAESEKGDILAQNIVKQAAWAFSAALHNIVLNFDPEVIIIQGNYAFAGTWFDGCLHEGLACFPRNTDEVSFLVQYDKRPLISLQMMGATKLLTRKFFSSSEWI
ncbi:MAG: ROK family transcriptional regulator [Hespellia sp.]|nr:ROK family transcriptional regulator [Hespellia sp.]